MLRSDHKRLATILVVAAVGGGVLISHGALAMDHMGDGAAMCVAVLDAGLLATGLTVLHRRARPMHSRHPLVFLRPLAFARAPAPQPAARIRAGPERLQVFRR
jgi:hypothetical protein